MYINLSGHSIIYDLDYGIKTKIINKYLLKLEKGLLNRFYFI